MRTTIQNLFPVPWFVSEASWYLAKQASVDPSAFGEDYAQWQRAVVAEIHELSEEGFHAYRVALDADRLNEWCSERRLPLDRLSCLMYTVSRMHDAGSHP